MVLNHNLVLAKRFYRTSSINSEKSSDEPRPYHKNGDSQGSGLFTPLTEAHVHKPKTKISVIGSGSVGTAIAVSVMTKSISDALVVIDCEEKRVAGEVLDLQQCSQFVDHCLVSGGKGYSYTNDSDVVFITAGARQREGESRLNLIQRNLNIFKCVVPEVVQHSPNCTLVVVSNPGEFYYSRFLLFFPSVDILTHAAWKFSGFPRHRVLGSGTLLDSARFRYFIGRKLGVAPASVHAYVIGEHGDSSVPVWSKISIGGQMLSDTYPKIGREEDLDKFSKIHKDVVDSAYEIIRLKGYTSWAIGLSCAALSRALLHDQNTILPVSTNVKGLFGIDYDVFLSMPCVINSDGVRSIVNLNLSAEERQKFKASAEILKAASSDLAW
ncbi:unnamed protein product [Dibothriocephalus latus]|uniref:L-lactate dehydrogenase n=1 Tax=Dibothriocephalus latus TaxID=60516 RepID=A0A3P7LPC7_DIBLA|nr:unnamed protein product [Dibothriocephalus latus]